MTNSNGRRFKKIKKMLDKLAAVCYNEFIN